MPCLIINFITSDIKIMFRYISPSGSKFPFCFCWKTEVLSRKFIKLLDELLDIMP